MFVCRSCNAAMRGFGQVRRWECEQHKRMRVFDAFLLIYLIEGALKTYFVEGSCSIDMTDWDRFGFGNVRCTREWEFLNPFYLRVFVNAGKGKGELDDIKKMSVWFYSTGNMKKKKKFVFFPSFRQGILKRRTLLSVSFTRLDWKLTRRHTWSTRNFHCGSVIRNVRRGTRIVQDHK